MQDTCLISYLVDLLKVQPTRNILKPSVPHLKTKGRDQKGYFFLYINGGGGGGGAEAPSGSATVQKVDNKYDCDNVTNLAGEFDEHKSRHS